MSNGVKGQEVKSELDFFVEKVFFADPVIKRPLRRETIRAEFFLYFLAGHLKTTAMRLIDPNNRAGK